VASPREIWEAGRRALGLDVTLEVPPAPPDPPAPVVAPDPVDAGVFNPTAFPFDRAVYRVQFKNGLSGEYSGAALKANFPFDVREVLRVESVD
jgi:hypothetical protein